MKKKIRSSRVADRCRNDNTWNMAYKKIVVILVVVISLSSCSHYRWVDRHREEVIAHLGITTDSSSTSHNETIIQESIEDTFIVIGGDEATIQALFECDSLGRVYLKQIADLKLGSHIQPSIHQGPVDNSFVFECMIDSHLVYLQYKKTHIIESSSSIHESTTEVPPKIIEKKVGRFYVIFTWAVIAAIALFIAYHLNKNHKSKQL
jgi:hypothetical protein